MGSEERDCIRVIGIVMQEGRKTSESRDRHDPIGAFRCQDSAVWTASSRGVIDVSSFGISASSSEAASCTFR